MLFSEEILNGFKDEPHTGVTQVMSIVRENMDQGMGWSENDYEVLLEAFLLIDEVRVSKILNVVPSNFSISGEKDVDCKNMHAYLEHVEKQCVRETSKLKAESLRMHFRTALGVGFCYEFSQGDLDRVQVLLNQLRDSINGIKTLQDDHKRRLLARLEKLQSELHKKVSDLDRFWGLIGDAGIVIGKLGQDAKPIVDRIREIADIVWQTQSRAEELPSGTQIPMLGTGQGSGHDRSDSAELS